MPYYDKVGYKYINNNYKTKDKYIYNNYKIKDSYLNPDNNLNDIIAELRRKKREQELLQIVNNN